MRAFPLIILFYYLPEKEAYIKALRDTNLTNPNPVNRDATLVYLSMLRLILQERSPTEALPEIFKIIQTDPIKEAFNQAIKGEIRDVKISKGWVVHGIYLSIQAWIQASLGRTFSEVINWVILQGGDTDTNATIAGSVIGMYYGEKKKILEEENIKILLSTDPSKGDLPVDPKYHPATALSILQ